MPRTASRPTAPQPAFERINRGVRRAIFLLQHIAKQLTAGSDRDQYRIRARAQIMRDVEDVTRTRPEAERNAYAAELCERLDDPEFDENLSGMTIAQASLLIRHDFGLGKIFTHKRRTPADVKSLAARARHSAHAAALAAVLRHEALIKRQL